VARGDGGRGRLGRLILALETSCDDTCAAVIDGPRILSNVVSSQAAFHERYGGVVPEVASRHHLELVNAVVAAALEEAGTELPAIDSVAVTRGPGLIGALLVGLSTAKALAAAHRKPLIPVDHLHGHVAANFLEPDPLEPPFLCLIASGGHTLLAGVSKHSSFDVLGQTVDDAAGEAFDKGARLLGLGYPGGPAIQRAAEEGDPEAFDFPVAMSERGLDFSFSGVKTSLVYRVRDLGPEETERRRADLAASFQRAITDQLVAKLRRAARSEEWPAIALGGGVAANAELRERTRALCDELGLGLKLVPLSLCTDNAAMIGSAARFSQQIAYPDYLDFDAFTSSPSVRAA
jgi:tRNA N6-adenosine threonylcarbamoyltransferase